MGYYKFTGKNGETYNGFKWSLPTKNADVTWTPGEWTAPVDGDVVLCGNGYHFTDEDHINCWLREEMYEVEYKEPMLLSPDIYGKYVCKSARLTKRIEKFDGKCLLPLFKYFVDLLRIKYNKRLQRHNYPSDISFIDVLGDFLCFKVHGRILIPYLTDEATLNGHLYEVAVAVLDSGYDHFYTLSQIIATCINYEMEYSNNHAPSIALELSKHYSRIILDFIGET